MGIKNIMKSEIVNSDKCFIHDLKKIVDDCRRQAYRTVNYAQVMMNWRIGQRIVEQEQGGSERAEYGKYVIKLASESLTEEYGRGFSESNIRSFRKFYTEYKELAIQQTVSAESSAIQQTLSVLLPWSHYERLMRVILKQESGMRMRQDKKCGAIALSTEIFQRNIMRGCFFRK